MKPYVYEELPVCVGVIWRSDSSVPEIVNCINDDVEETTKATKDQYDILNAHGQLDEATSGWAVYLKK